MTRRKGPTRNGNPAGVELHTTPIYHCPHHGLSVFIGRRAARAAARRLPARKHIREYPCEYFEDGWHFGPLPATVVRGTTTVGEITSTPGRRIRKGPAQKGVREYRADTPLVLSSRITDRLSEMMGIPIVWAWTTHAVQQETAWFTTSNNMHGTFTWHTREWQFSGADVDCCNQSCDIIFADGATPEQATARAHELRRHPDRGWFSRPRWSGSYGRI